MKLNAAEKKEFQKKGFLKIAGVVNEKAINVALREINHSLGKGMHPEKVASYNSTSYCPDLIHKASILNLLYETPAWEIIESAIAPRKFKIDGGAQIALRFPVMQTPGALHPHIDGMYSSKNKIPKDSIYSFTALAGILLSDTPNRFWGNFTAWPGTHSLFSNYFLEHGTEILKRSLPPVKISDPEQILGKAGDMILSHYLTAHTVVSNVSPYIRYAVFFRIKHVDHEFYGQKVFTDLWHQWPGLRAKS
jgi:hypothetical protein